MTTDNAKPQVTVGLEAYRKLLIENSALRRKVTVLEGKIRELSGKGVFHSTAKTKQDTPCK